MRINSTHSTHRIYNMYNSWQTCITCEHDTYNGFALTRELLEKKKTRFSFTNPVALFISSNSDEVDKFLVAAAIPWMKYKSINVLSIHWFGSSILLLVNHNHYNALHDFYVQLLLKAKKIILFFKTYINKQCHTLVLPDYLTLLQKTSQTYHDILKCDRYRYETWLFLMILSIVVIKSSRKLKHFDRHVFFLICFFFRKYSSFFSYILKCDLIAYTIRRIAGPPLFMPS